VTRINEKARGRDATDGSGALGRASVELTFRQGGGGGRGGGEATSLRPDSLGATAAADKSGEQLPVPESEAATMRKAIAQHVCASLSILPECVLVTVLQSDVAVSSWGTTPVTKATVEITAATPGQTHSNALTCALALASQACDTSSPLCKRLPALLSGQLIDRTRASPTPMCNTMSLRTLPSTRPSQYLPHVAQDFASAEPLPAVPASLKPTPMGLVGGETLAPALDTPREQVASGGGGWAGVKLQGQQQVCKGPVHAARQFPRGYACACIRCMPWSSLFLFKILNLSVCLSPHSNPGPARAHTHLIAFSLVGLLDGAR
jgi:hypothetical protein